MFDVVVVGARCAGSPTAMLLARAGYRVLLLERAAVLGDTLSTLYIQPAGVRLLSEWGVLDALLATGCPRINHRTFGIGDVTLSGAAETTCAPRRRVLDQVLASAAVDAGAQLRLGWTVTEVLREGGRVTGVRCRTPDGVREVSARLVVGADGVRSKVARAVGARAYVEHPLKTCAYYTYWSGVPAHFETYSAPGRAVGCFPTHDDRTLVVTYFPRETFAQVRADPLGSYLANVREAAPSVARRMDKGQREERVYGTGWQPNYLRPPSGPGWALVGDAGHHKDSITAQGITDAFHQAAILAGCVGADLFDETALSDALEAYTVSRERLVEANFPVTLQLAAMEVPDDLSQLRAVAADPGETARALSAFAGTYPDDIADLVPSRSRSGAPAGPPEAS